MNHPRRAFRAVVLFAIAIGVGTAVCSAREDQRGAGARRNRDSAAAAAAATAPPPSSSLSLSSLASSQTQTIEEPRQDQHEKQDTESEQTSEAEPHSPHSRSHPLPNIVMIVLDDLGSHDLGLHGTGIHTPNIDGFVTDTRKGRNRGSSSSSTTTVNSNDNDNDLEDDANDSDDNNDGNDNENDNGGALGIYLQNYYVLPYCSPTRAALLSGMYPLRTGVHNVIRTRSTAGLPLDVETLPEMLRRASTANANAKANAASNLGGYKTHAVGKWHLGHSSWEQTPTFRGFDSFFGFYMGGQDYFSHKEEGGVDLHHDTRPFCGEGCSRVVGTETGNYSTHVFTREAINVVERHAQTQTQTQTQVSDSDSNPRPLFLYLAYQAVHCPNEVPDSYIEPYKNRTDWTERRRNYAGMLTAADEGIGNLTSALKQHGLWNNTLLIVTTDNGGPSTIGCVQGSSNDPKRGGKCSLWEGGTTGDALLAGPALDHLLTVGNNPNRARPTPTPTPKRNKKGTPTNRYPHLFHVVDWFPTLAEWVGVVPLNRTIQDGVSQASALAYSRHGGGGDGESDRDYDSDPPPPPPPPRTELFGGYAQCEDRDHSNPRSRDWFGPSLRHNHWKLVRGKSAGPDASNLYPRGSDTILPPGDRASASSGRSNTNNNNYDYNYDYETKYNDNDNDNDNDPSDHYLLFDLNTDPGEINDLSAERPDVLRFMIEKLRLYRHHFVYPQRNDDEECPFPGLVNTTEAGPAWLPWCKDLQEQILALQ